MTIDPGTTVLLITIGTAAITGIVTLVKLFKGRNEWKDEIQKLRIALEKHHQQNRLEFQQIESKIALLEVDAEKIEEVKRYIDRVEDSIDRETSKLEKKIDDLMKVIIENIRR